MPPDNSPTIVELPHLKDEALEIWLKFLAAAVNRLTAHCGPCRRKVDRLVLQSRLTWAALGVVAGVLFTHLGWK